MTDAQDLLSQHAPLILGDTVPAMTLWASGDGVAVVRQVQRPLGPEPGLSPLRVLFLKCMFGEGDGGKGTVVLCPSTPCSLVPEKLTAQKLPVSLKL
jgi:hypothetical protein